MTTPAPETTGTLSINDILNLNGNQMTLSQDFNILTALVSLAIAFVMGLFIYIVYRRTFSGVMYSRNFNVSLIMLTMVTTLIILPISSNLTLSLGMVGALSIVRFRTAVKDPVDTVFMFWSIAAGIAIGAKFYLQTVFACIVIGVILFIVSMVKVKNAAPFLLVLHFEEASYNQVKALLKQVPQGRLKSKTVSHSGVELTIEIRVKENETQFVHRFLSIPGVHDAALISYQGDIIS